MLFYESYINVVEIFENISIFSCLGEIFGVLVDIKIIFDIKIMDLEVSLILSSDVIGIEDSSVLSF